MVLLCIEEWIGKAHFVFHGPKCLKFGRLLGRDFFFGLVGVRLDSSLRLISKAERVCNSSSLDLPKVASADPWVNGDPDLTQIASVDIAPLETAEVGNAAVDDSESDGIALDDHVCFDLPYTTYITLTLYEVHNATLSFYVYCLFTYTITIKLMLIMSIINELTIVSSFF